MNIYDLKYNSNDLDHERDFPYFIQFENCP